MADKNPLIANHIFEGKLKEYENILIKFVLDSGRAKNVEDSTQLILGYIGIHKGGLTQKQLKGLTKLSSGTISKKLRILLNLGIIKKERIPRTNKYLYIVTPEGYQDTADSTLNDISKIIFFLQEKVKDIEDLYDQKGLNFLSRRIKSLINTFQIVQNIWSDLEFLFKSKKEKMGT